MNQNLHGLGDKLLEDFSEQNKNKKSYTSKAAVSYQVKKKIRLCKEILLKAARKA